LIFNIRAFEPIENCLADCSKARNMAGIERRQAVMLSKLQSEEKQGACRSHRARVLQEAKRAFGSDEFCLVSLGIHERDPLRSLVRAVPRYGIRAHGFITSLHNDQDAISAMASGIPMEDFALVSVHTNLCLKIALHQKLRK
jgi:hypothetical protein